MSALYGRMQGERGQVTRTAHHNITVTLETWEGKISVNLRRDGSFTVEVGDKYAGGFGMLPVVSGSIESESARREVAGTYAELDS